MYFQDSDYKRRNFLDLNDNNNQPIHLTYSKGDTWPKHISLSNSLYICVIKMIINHDFIREYRLRLFPSEFLYAYVMIILLRCYHISQVQSKSILLPRRHYIRWVLLNLSLYLV